MNKANDIINWKKNFKQVAEANDLSFYQHAYIEDFISELLYEQMNLNLRGKIFDEIELISQVPKEWFEQYCKNKHKISQ